MKTKPGSLNLVKKIPAFLFVTLLCWNNVFAASKTDKSEESPQQIAETLSPENNRAVSIKLPGTTKRRTYLYKINPAVVSAVEDGSPQALRDAMTAIRKNESEYAENEKVLIQVAADIMKIAYPSEKVGWETYAVTEANPYTGAINSVKNGIYDTATGNVDFLSTLLPSLIILNNKLKDDDKLACENSIRAALTMKPDSVLANYIAGIYFEQCGKLASSEFYFSRAYEKCNSNLEISLEYAKLLNENGKAFAAEKVMAGITPTDATNLQILKQNAYISFNRGDYDKAEEYVARVLQQTPNNREFVLFRAKIFIEKKDYIHAVSLLDMYARQDDSSIDYLILRSKVQLDWSKNTNGATETVEKALNLYPDNEECLILAARIASITDSPVAGKYADELAEIVLAKNPDNISALEYALSGLVQRQNWMEAYTISTKLIQSKKDTPEVVLCHVEVCLNLGRKTEAMESAKKVYEKYPDNETAVQSYILASTTVLSRDEALKLVNSLMNTNSSKIKSYLYYRRSFLQFTEDNVLSDLRSSLISNPRNSDALFRLYEIYFAKNEYRKAQYYLRQVVSINPNDTSIKKLNDALTQLIQ